MRTIQIGLLAIAAAYSCGCATVTVPGPGDCNLVEISFGVKEQPTPTVRVVHVQPPRVPPVESVETPKPKTDYEETPSQPMPAPKTIEAPAKVKPVSASPSVIPGPVSVEPPPPMPTAQASPAEVKPSESPEPSRPSGSEAASRLVAHAYRRYTNMDYAATRSFSDYVADLTDLPAKERAAGCILSGAARYLEGKAEEADQYFGRAKALAPYTKPSPSVFPKEILDRYAAALPVHFWPRPSTSLANLPNFLRQVNVENFHGE